MMTLVDDEASSSARTAYFTRSKLSADNWKAAGVLPFAFSSSRCWVLLGGEIMRTGPGGKYRQFMWRDFGGQREALDEDSAATASRQAATLRFPLVQTLVATMPCMHAMYPRECSEETLGMLWGSSSADNRAIHQSTKALAYQLRQGRQSMCSVHKLKKVKRGVRSKVC